MRVAVVGANGQLGTDLSRIYARRGHQVIPMNHKDCDVRDLEACRTQITPERADLIISTAALHHVESCERDPAGAFAVNSVGARNLALLSEELGCALAYVSTDYVFDGSKGSAYIESDLPRPLNVYGNTKLSGELFAMAHTSRHFIVRVSGLYGCAPCRGKGGRNFVQLMLGLAHERGEVRVVDDEMVSPTWTEDVAKQMEVLTGTREFGLYHLSTHGQCSWYEFAAEIFRLTGTSVKLSRADSTEFPAKVARPKYSVLENARLKDVSLDCMPQWSDSLRGYLQSPSS